PSSSASSGRAGSGRRRRDGRRTESVQPGDRRARRQTATTSPHELFLRKLVLPLKERRMQSAVGRSGGDMLCDLRILGTVSGDHQHDTIYRNGFKRLPFQQFIENIFWLTLGNGNPVS